MLSAFGNEDGFERTVCTFIACEGTITGMGKRGQ